jgi:hypothetical protein
VKDWIYVVFFSVFFEVTFRSKGDVLAGLIAALTFSLCYLAFLLVNIRFFSKNTKLKYPVLLKIPNSSDQKQNSSFRKSRFFPSYYNEMD